MANVEADESKSGIQVIARAATILRVLKDEREGLSLGQIADRVGLPRSTVQRIVGALQTERFVMAAGPERGIRLGPELQSLADAAKIDMAQMLRPYLIDLSRQTEETVDLSVLRNNKLLFLDQVPGTQRLRAVSFVGDIFPLTTTANGKACLAVMSDNDFTRAVELEWAGRGGKQRSLDDFRVEIAAVRKAGVAYDDDEHTIGISAVGIAFRDWQSNIYAISIPAPTARFRKNKSRYADDLRSLSVRIEKALQTFVAP